MIKLIPLIRPMSYTGESCVEAELYFYIIVAAGVLAMVILTLYMKKVSKEDSDDTD